MVVELVVQRDGGLRVTCDECGDVDEFVRFAEAWQWLRDHPCVLRRVPRQPGPPGTETLDPAQPDPD